MKRIKRIIAAVAASAMVFGMSFSTFAAPQELSIAATVTEGGTEAVVTVSAGTGVNANGIDAYVKYDASKMEPVVVMDGEDVDAFAYFTEAFQAATKGYMYTIGNETADQQMHIITASAKDVEIPEGTAIVTFKFTLKEAVTEEVGAELDLGFKLGVNTLMDMDGNDLPQSTTGNLIEAPAVVEPVTSTTSEAPSEAPSDVPSNVPSEVPSDVPTAAPSAVPTAAPSGAPKASTAPSKTTTPGKSPKTADTASVVVPVIALCGAAAAIVVASKKKVNE